MMPLTIPQRLQAKDRTPLREGCAVFHRLRKVAAGLVVAVATGVTAWTSAKSALPQPPVPGAEAILSYLVSGRDPLAVATAILSAVSAGWSFWEMFQPQPASINELKGETSILQGQLEGVLVAGDRHAASSAEGLESIAIMVRRLVEQGARAEQAELAGRTTGELMASDDHDDRQIGQDALTSSPQDAAEQLLRRAELERTRQNERFRQAARLLAPLQPSRAIAAYEQAVGVEASDSASWLEMGRLQSQAGLRVAAAANLARAAETEADPREKSCIDSEIAALLITERKFDEASQRLLNAIRVNDELIEDEGRTYLLLHDRSVFQMRFGDLALTRGDAADAERFFKSSVDLREQLLSAFPDDDDDRRELATAKAKLGRVAFLRGDFNRAADVYSEALLAFRELLKRTPTNELRRNVAISLKFLGKAEWGKGNRSEAINHSIESTAIFGTLVQVDGGAGGWASDFAESVHDLAKMTVATSDFAGGAQHLRRAVSVLEPIAAAMPHERGIYSDLTAAIGFLGNIEIASDEVDAGSANIVRAFKMRVETYDADRSSLSALSSLATGRADLAIMELQTDPHRAYRQILEAISIFEELAEQAPDRPGLTLGLPSAQKTKARIEEYWPQVMSN